METTTKKCKTEKLKSKKRICWEVTVNSLGNPCSQSWRRKGKTVVVRICRKGRNYLFRECCNRCRFQPHMTASSSAWWSRFSPPPVTMLTFILMTPRIPRYFWAYPFLYFLVFLFSTFYLSLPCSRSSWLVIKQDFQSECLTPKCSDFEHSILL